MKKYGEKVFKNLIKYDTITSEICMTFFVLNYIAKGDTKNLFTKQNIYFIIKSENKEKPNKTKFTEAFKCTSQILK